jgi:acyl transferase domain-containing protein
MFTGQGSDEFLDMCHSLYQSSSVFRNAMEYCDFVVNDLYGMQFCTLISDKTSSAIELLKISDSSIYQLFLIVLEYSLCQEWFSRGFYPSFVVGHSLGEYVAAVIAGVFSIEDCLMLVYSRAMCIVNVCRGEQEMWAIESDAATIQREIAKTRLHSTISIASVNYASNLTVSGHKKSIQMLCSSLDPNIRKFKLPVQYAFHSSLMDNAAEAFLRNPCSCVFATPKVTFVSFILKNISECIFLIRFSFKTMRYRSLRYLEEKYTQMNI